MRWVVEMTTEVRVVWADWMIELTGRGVEVRVRELARTDKRERYRSATLNCVELWHGGLSQSTTHWERLCFPANLDHQVGADALQFNRLAGAGQQYLQVVDTRPCMLSRGTAGENQIYGTW